MWRRKAHIDAEEIEQVIDASALDGQPSIHEGLAELQPAIEEKLASNRGVVKAKRDGAPGVARKDMLLALRVADAQRPATHDMAQQGREQHWANPPRFSADALVGN